MKGVIFTANTTCVIWGGQVTYPQVPMPQVIRTIRKLKYGKARK